MNSNLLAMLFLATLSCRKPKPVIPPEPVDTSKISKLNLVWKKPLSNPIREFLSIQPKVYESNVLFSSDELSPTTNVMVLLNGKTGDEIWQWGSFLENIGLGKNSNYIVGNMFIYGDWYETGVVDLKTGSMDWQYLMPTRSGMPRITIEDGHIYHKHRSVDGGLRAKHVSLVRSPLTHAAWDTICTIQKVDGYVPSIEGPSLWVSPEGDDILVFQGRTYNFEQTKGKIDFYAFNLTADSVQFLIEDIEPSGNSNVVTPLVDGNYAYFLGARSVSCIDLIKGEVVWQNLFYGDGAHLLGSNLLIIDQKLIIKQDHHIIRAVNKLDGSAIWIQNNGGYTPSHMIHHDGIIYYTADGDGTLMAINAENGAVIWQEKSPHDYYGSPHEGAFNGGVAVDPDLGHIYVADYYYAMCFKLPEKP